MMEAGYWDTTAKDEYIMLKQLKNFPLKKIKAHLPQPFIWSNFLPVAMPLCSLATKVDNGNVYLDETLSN